MFLADWVEKMIASLASLSFWSVWNQRLYRSTPIQSSSHFKNIASQCRPFGKVATRSRQSWTMWETVGSVVGNYLYNEPLVVFFFNFQCLFIFLFSSFAVCLGPSLQLTDAEDCVTNERVHARFPHCQCGAQEHTGPPQSSCAEATADHG